MTWEINEKVDKYKYDSVQKGVSCRILLYPPYKFHIDQITNKNDSENLTFNNK